MDEKCRQSFDLVAKLYEEVRPQYPEKLIDDVIDLTSYQDTEDMLEIGCGPGKASIMFAKKGCKVLALEPGKELAKIAANNLSIYPDCKVEVTRFEDWDNKQKKFKVLFAATSYHWVDSNVRYTKPVEVLSEDGWIALFWNNRLEYQSDLKSKLDAIYKSYSLESETGQNKQKLREFLIQQEKDIDSSGNFTNIQTIEYPWQETYDAKTYVKLLDTFSHHQVLEPKIRKDLNSKIIDLILSHGGTIDIPYLTTLTLAKKK